MKTMEDMTGTAKPKLEMEGYWMHLTYDAKMGKTPFHFEEYTTFDAASKQWRRVMVESGGGHSVGTSSGPKDNKMDWELATVGAMGAELRPHVAEFGPQGAAVRRRLAGATTKVRARWFQEQAGQTSTT